jgi:hypothetical protein
VRLRNSVAPDAKRKGGAKAPPLGTAPCGKSLDPRGGAHPKAIQEMLGHESITTTTDLYGHMLPLLEDQTADRLDT